MSSKLKYFIRRPLQLPVVLITKLPYFGFIRDTADYQYRITFEWWFKQKVLNFGGNRRAYWPVHWTSKVYDVENIKIGIDSYPGYSNGCYIQGQGTISIGDHVQIGPNVFIVSANHDLYDNRKHNPAPVKIGNYCWIGGGAKIMPGVELGDWTIVGAGAVVTKSFPEGHCVLGGMPARVLKELDGKKCVPFRNRVGYYGYIPASRFEAFRKKYLTL